MRRLPLLALIVLLATALTAGAAWADDDDGDDGDGRTATWRVTVTNLTPASINLRAIRHDCPNRVRP